MRIILGKFKGKKMRVPEFHKNGKRNEKFDYYKQFVGKDEENEIRYRKKPKSKLLEKQMKWKAKEGKLISKYKTTHLIIKEV